MNVGEQLFLVPKRGGGHKKKKKKKKKGGTKRCRNGKGRKSASREIEKDCEGCS